MMNEPKSGPPANFAFASAPAREPSKSPPAQPPRPQSRLAKVQGGRKREPARVMIVGPEGVGKTSTLASAPAPIVIDADGGSGLVAIARYPFRDGPGGDVPESLEEIHAAVADLTENEHVGAPPGGYKTIGIDTVDRVDALIQKFVVEQHSGKKTANNRGAAKLRGIEDIGWGKGRDLVLDEWRNLCRALEKLRLVRDMNIILTAHVSIRTFKDPEGEDYDRYFLRVHEKTAGFLREWVEVCGFYSFDRTASRLGLSEDAPRAKAVMTRRRILRTQPFAAFDAKTRLALPDEIEVDVANPWGPIGAAIAAARDMTPVEVVRLIRGEVHRIGDPELGPSVEAAIAKEQDTAKLQRYLMDLRRRKPHAAPEQAP